MRAWRLGCLACLVLVLLPTTGWASTFVPNPAARLSASQRQVIQQLWKPDLELSEALIRQGLKHEVEGRNWARLTQKLATEGSTVTIVAFGGSVTVGYRLSNTSYPEELVAWLQGVFPAVNFKLHNMARRATAATFAALCLVQDLPEETDLVLIEYSVNGYGGQCQCFTSPQTAGYETLLRKVITKAPHAAMLGFASFMWLDKDNKPGKYYETGEDQHGVVCKRYGVPMMSVRDAMYDVMFDPANEYGVNRSAILVDIVHVGDYGARVYAAFLAWALRHQVTRILLHHKSLAAAAARVAPMPAPLNPEAAQESWPSFCAEGLALQKYITDQTGWRWVDEGSNACAGCHKYGYLTNEANASISVTVNSDILSAADKERGEKVMVALTFLKSYSDVGKGKVECVSGCECTPKVFDAKNSRPTSELHTERMELAAGGPACVLRLTVLPDSTTGGHKFRLASVAVHKADKVMSFMYGPVYDR